LFNLKSYSEIERQQVEKISNTSFDVELSFNKVIEFRGNSSNEYNPNNSNEVLQTVDLSTLTYSMLSYETKNISNVAVHMVKFYAKSNVFFSNVTFTAKIVSSEIVDSFQAQGKRKTIISPNAIKLDMHIQGIRYSRSDSLLAIGSILESKTYKLKSKVKRTSIATILNQQSNTVFSQINSLKNVNDDNDNDNDDDKESVEKDSEDQDVFTIDEPESNTRTGVFSFKNYVTESVSSGSVSVPIKNTFRSSKISLETETEDGQTYQKKKVTTQFYFTVSNQMGSVYWDPSIAKSESTTSGAHSTFGNSFMYMCTIVCAIVCFMLY